MGNLYQKAKKVAGTMALVGLAALTLSCNKTEQSKYETPAQTAYKAQVVQQANQKKAQGKMAENRETCWEKEGYDLVPITYNYDFKDGVLYMSDPTRPSNDAEKWRQHIEKPRANEKIRAIWLGIEGDTGASFNYREGSFSLYNFDPTTCSREYADSLPEGKSLLITKNIGSRADAKRLVAAFSHYVSQPDMKWIGIDKKELITLDRAISKRIGN